LGARRTQKRKEEELKALGETHKNITNSAVVGGKGLTLKGRGFQQNIPPVRNGKNVKGAREGKL